MLANQGSNVALQEMKMLKIHSSEWAWLGSDFDFEIDNNGTIDDLYNTVVKTLEIGD